MVVRLTPARRATSSRATPRNPCCSKSTSAASRIVSVAGDELGPVAGDELGPVVGSAPGIARLREFVVPQTHWQMVPYPIHRAGATDRGEALIAVLLALAPRQTQHVPRPWRHAAGGEERRNGIEDQRDQPPHHRVH